MRKALLVVAIFAAAISGTFAYFFKQRHGLAPDFAEHCATALRSPAEIESAMQEGYDVDMSRRCIRKESHAALKRAREQQAARVQERAKPNAERETAVRETLAEARAGFRTNVSDPASGRPPLPTPPGELFVRLDFDSPVGKLPAFVTPRPGNADKHPAIVWLTGGDTNSLDDFWSPQPAANDQTARPFRDAGVVMMFPTLRGGNANPGRKEYFLGEVEDVVAAAARLAQLPYVDPARIYLGGHSTGGTLALLVAASSSRFAGVFALGPVTRIADYPPSIMKPDFASIGGLEARLRSPIHWLAGIESPTYVIEGTVPPGNHTALEQLCAAAKSNDKVVCVPVAGSDHFSVITCVTRVIAARLAVPSGSTRILRPDEFAGPEGAAR